MIVKLPTVKRTPIYEDEKLVDVKIEKVYIPFKVDFSMFAEERFEKNFKHQLPDNSFSEYALRIAKINPQNAAELQANLLSILKLLYCFLESDEAPTFKDFLQLFDYSIAKELFEEVIHIVQLSQQSVVKN